MKPRAWCKHHLPLLILLSVLLLDQGSKFLVKLNMQIGDDIPLLPWFHIHFLENEGMAFGLSLGEEAGKLLLSLIRLALIGLLIWYLGKANKLYRLALTASSSATGQQSGGQEAGNGQLPQNRQAEEGNPASGSEQASMEASPTTGTDSSCTEKESRKAPGNGSSKKAEAPGGLAVKTSLIVSLSLILAGAIGNMLDCAFYGLIFSESYFHVAQLFPEGGGYAPFLFGHVVDMLHFPLFQGSYPEWMPLVGGKEFLFFRPVFNLADSAVTIGFLIFLFTQRSFWWPEKKA